MENKKKKIKIINSSPLILQLMYCTCIIWHMMGCMEIMYKNALWMLHASMILYGIALHCVDDVLVGKALTKAKEREC